MQFVKCKFRASDTRTYTYINEGEDLAVGDVVKVTAARSTDGTTQRVEVVEIVDEEPPFACKPILGKIEPDAPEQAAA